MSLAKKILQSKKPFVLFHTDVVFKNILEQAIIEEKSIDLDVCVDDVGNPYLGHSQEYYEKSKEFQEKSMPIWEVIELISKSNIPVIVDCKHYNAWSVVEEIVFKIGEKRCLVHSFASEFKFNYSRKENEPDFISEWSPIKKLNSFKNKFPEVTTSASCKWLPDDLLISEKYFKLLQSIRKILKENNIDTVCLNIPNETFSDKSLNYFLIEKIIPHIGIDNIDTTELSELYIGETDDLKLASSEINCRQNLIYKRF